MGNKVTVITPSYNSAKYISETVRSVQNQTYDDWEMIIVDDCSQDNTCEIIESFIEKDNRIRLIKQETNQGAGAARTLAMRNSTGKYIAYLDADDIWLPDKLEKQIKFMIQLYVV